jgi:hypothetical protein
MFAAKRCLPREEIRSLTRRRDRDSEMVIETRRVPSRSAAGFGLFWCPGREERAMPAEMKESEFRDFARNFVQMVEGSNKTTALPATAMFYASSICLRLGEHHLILKIILAVLATMIVMYFRAGLVESARRLPLDERKNFHQF